MCDGLIPEVSLPPFCYLGIFLGYCGVCSREYANIHQHREIHQYNKQPIACPFCSKTFSSKNSMRVHKSLFHRDALRKWLMICSHWNTNNFSHFLGYKSTSGMAECPYCYKNIQKNNLRRHIEDIHSESKNLPCDLCGKVFSSQNKLRSHKYYHKTLTSFPSHWFLIFLPSN